MHMLRCKRTGMATPVSDKVVFNIQRVLAKKKKAI